jgi:hypothetical protein
VGQAAGDGEERAVSINKDFQLFKQFNRYAEPVLSGAEGFNLPPVSSPTSVEEDRRKGNVLNDLNGLNVLNQEAL